MNVSLTLHGILRDYLPKRNKGKTTVTLSDGATVQDVVDQLEIKRGISAAVDGQEVGTDYTLQDGSDLHLFKMIGGG